MKKSSRVPFVALPEVSAQDMALILRHADCLFARPGAGMTTEAVACGTPVVFDLSRGVMPQETNNLNFWKKRASSVLSTPNPSRLPELADGEVPSVKIEMGSDPGKLLDALRKLLGK